MNKLKVPYSYLKMQFGDEERKRILKAIEDVAEEGDFTLGRSVGEFEEKFAALCRAKYAVGMNSGTAALIAILEALGIGSGDEVITVPNSFIATAAAIDLVKARVVFVDVDDQYQIDVNRIEGAITSRTKAILPVHLTGCPADMAAINDIAERRNLYVVEDAAQAVCAEIDGKSVGHLGIGGEFSFHPLKNLNGWGDAGAVVTDHKWLRDKVAKWRNHGMKNRDEVEFFSVNERMHSTAAAVLNCLMGHAEDITEKRIANAALYDRLILPMSGFVALPPRQKNKKQVYHTYVIRVLDGKRDGLQKFLLEERGIDTKVHYPIPIHLQEAASHLGYRPGDFPNCERQSLEILTLPVHQYLTAVQIIYVAESIADFFYQF